MKLVENWRNAWKWFSVQALAALTVLPMVWLGLPADVKAYVPPKYGLIVVILLGLAGVIGRVVDQNKTPPSPNP